MSERLEYLAAQLAIFTDELRVVRRIAHSKAAFTPVNAHYRQFAVWYRPLSIH
jgi:hypothetical protein